MNDKKHNRSIAAKIVIISLLACTAVSLSLYISKVTFRGILNTVAGLSKPNDKLHLVNDIFHSVVKLDHLQRRQALKTEQIKYNPFVNESGHVQLLLDSLRAMSEASPQQIARIDSMKKILYSRDLLFLKYVRSRLDYIKNDTLAEQVKDLSVMIEQARAGINNNKVTTTTVTRTIVDTLPQQPEEKKNLWNRIFSKKKPAVRQVQRQVQEDMNVQVDTLALGGKGDSLAMLGHAMEQVASNRVSHRAQLLAKQAELNNAGDKLISQLISILNEIDQDERTRSAGQDAAANRLVSEGVKNISAVLIIFIAAIVVLMMFVLGDIARSNRYRRQLQAAKEEAEEAGRAKQRFLASMSHELRTPLQAIIGISEQAMAVSQPGKQDLVRIHQSSLHLLQIVNEVLDYSRVISGKYAIESKPFNMSTLLTDVREMVSVQLAAKNLQLHYNATIDPQQYYMGDPFRLTQVLLNLLGNAIKFTDEGSVTLFVTAAMTDRGRALLTFAITDTGPGISPEDLAVIFNEFEQGSSYGRKPGTGLGLTIVKAMVDLQHGELKAESEQGKGSTFTVMLPYDLTDQPLPEQGVAHIATAFKGHVWVVDDDKFILQLCDAILTKHAVPHTCFLSAAAASIEPFPADIAVVFLDVRMEEMNGIELCRRLRERPEVPRYIALTAQAFSEEQDELLRSGFNSLLIKPFREQDLISVIIEGSNNAGIQDAPALQLPGIRKMTGDNEELFNKVLRTFAAETAQDLDSARQCVAAADIPGLAEQLHRLAGRCGQVGLVTLGNSLRAAEVALRSEVGDIDPGIEGIFGDVDVALAAIRRLLAARSVPTDC